MHVFRVHSWKCGQLCNIQITEPHQMCRPSQVLSELHKFRVFLHSGIVASVLILYVYTIFVQLDLYSWTWYICVCSWFCMIVWYMILCMTVRKQLCGRTRICEIWITLNSNHFCRVIQLPEILWRSIHTNSVSHLNDVAIFTHKGKRYHWYMFLPATLSDMLP